VRAFKSKYRMRDRSLLLRQLAVSVDPRDERAYFRLLDRFGRGMQQLDLHETGYLDLGGEGG